MKRTLIGMLLISLCGGTSFRLERHGGQTGH